MLRIPTEAISSQQIPVLALIAPHNDLPFNEEIASLRSQ